MATYHNSKLDLTYSPEADRFFCNECGGALHVERLSRRALALRCECCGHAVDGRLVNWSAASNAQSEYQQSVALIADRLEALAALMDEALAPKFVEVTAPVVVRRSWLARLFGR